MKPDEHVEFRGKKYPIVTIHIKNPEWEGVVRVAPESLEKVLGNETKRQTRHAREIDELIYHYVPSQEPTTEAMGFLGGSL